MKTTFSDMSLDATESDHFFWLKPEKDTFSDMGYDFSDLQVDLREHSRTLGMIHRTLLFKKIAPAARYRIFSSALRCFLVFWSGEIRKTASETSWKLIFSGMEPVFLIWIIFSDVIKTFKKLCSTSRQNVRPHGFEVELMTYRWPEWMTAHRYAPM